MKRHFDLRIQGQVLSHSGAGAQDTPADLCDPLREAIAEVRAIPLQRRRSRRLGSMAGTARILGDIVGPTGSLGDWEAWRD